MSNVYCIVGLGNPGSKYHDTRHNAGFVVIDKLAEFFKISEFEFEDNYLYAVTDYKDKQIALMKPLTFMNLSGKAVKAFYDKYEITAENFLIVYDDVNLDFGALRLRANGSDGVQNGIKSVIYEMETENIPRLRVGIRSAEDFEKLQSEEGFSLADYVLSGFSEKENELIDKVADSAKDAVLSFIYEGLEDTMNRFNRNVIDDLV
ncbi:MAG: aminoacyl-tRNA hydrolase [Ignavibacteria bacterium]|nr:aminoacyl-tRNA hydrolase [Ignavibacteria bacterium]